jgi:hypothetical protein
LQRSSEHCSAELFVELRSSKLFVEMLRALRGREEKNRKKK